MTVASDYESFIASKLKAASPAGFDWQRCHLPGRLFDWQGDVVLWALRQGRAALFLDTGLGKTGCQLAWADAVMKHTGKPVLLLCPLAVGPQTVREAEKFGIPNVRLAESGADCNEPGIHVTNYQKLKHFDPRWFAGVVLDESSILKSFTGSTKRQLCEAFVETPYKLCCTATPAPNDHAEIGSHAEFLGLCTRLEMLATFFAHDSTTTADWRLKGHAEGEFWRWVASWAVVARRPSDLGYPDEGYDLPPLRIHRHEVASGAAQPGRLFAVPEETLDGQRKARRATLAARVARAAELANADPDTPVLVWCELNDEADGATASIKGAMQAAGSHSDDIKAARMEAFSDGSLRALVSKPSICGFGMNWQHCHTVIFVGPSHSFEQWYQAVRRCWRFGQKHPVDVHVITSDLESAVFDNVERKQRDHDEMMASVIRHTSEANRASIRGVSNMKAEYEAEVVRGDGWELRRGDCCRELAALPDGSVGYSIFSPPFASLYTYSDSPRDMGNSASYAEFFTHLRFLVPELLRVTMPGRLLSFHCCNFPLMKERDGVIGLRDFRGDMIREFVAAGWVFHSEVCVWKDPVVEMQRTKSLGLLHKQVRKDAAMSRQGIPDYVVTVRKPGDNPSRVAHDAAELPVDLWQRYASPVWFDISQTDTLNFRAARDDRDERHICPLQLGVIERCLRLWTNPGDLVLSPFAGIGSEGHESLLLGRRFVGFELKESYFRLACRNLERAAKEAAQKDLFSFAGVE